MTDPNPSRAVDIAVRLTPTQAKHVADAIRIELASNWDDGWFSPLPSRAEVDKARSLLDTCTGQLDQLEWGEATGTVELHASRARLEGLADNLMGGADECLAETEAPADGRFCRTRRRGDELIATADAIRLALLQYAPAG